MTALLSAVGVCLLASLLTAVVVAVRGPPPAKRTYLFEDEAGRRYNPVAGSTAADAAESPTCRRCGTTVTSTVYRYCGTCGPSHPADD